LLDVISDGNKSHSAAAEAATTTESESISTSIGENGFGIT